MSQIIISVITAVFIGGVSGFLGSLMLERKMTLVAGPLGHLTLPGVALALIYKFNVALGAFPFVLLGIILIWFIERRTKLAVETITAVVFAFGVALSFLFLPLGEAERALVGDVSKVNFSGMVIFSLFSLFIFLVARAIQSKILLSVISRDLAKVEGVNVSYYELIYLLLVALLVSLGAEVVGSLLTAALVAIPAATARNISRSFSQCSLWSLSLGAFSALLGVFLSFFLKIPSGPAVILIAASFFAFSLIPSKNY